MKLVITNLLNSAIKELYKLDILSSIEKPKDLNFGDYTSNVSFVVSKNLGKNPIDISEEIVNFLQKENNNKNIADISAKAGFINFSFNRKYFSDFLNKIISQGKDFGKSKIYEGKKILVEHSSPNLFKPFHIGHMMNNTIGESLVRLADSSGADVYKISFPSDISLGVAKAVFILLEEGGDISIERLGDAYVKGTARYADDEAVQRRVKEIADNLYSNNESPELELYLRCKKINIDYFEKMAHRLGSSFDQYIFESEAGEIGKKIVKEYTPEVFTESEGAIVYIPDEDRKDINTSVFINSQGNPTYEAKDIGLLQMKFDKYNPDISIFITDTEQIPHFNVVLDAAKKINHIWSDRSVHVPHGRMSFKGQKMSSRLGGVPTAEDMLSTIKEEVMLRSNKNLNNHNSEMIAISAIKFAILKTTAGKNINFDPETSLSFEGDSGPYLQYSAVRAQAVLFKDKKSLLKNIINIFVNNKKEYLPEDNISLLEKNLIHYPYILERSIAEWSPHYMVGYLLELAQAFNTWYGNTKIIDNSKEQHYKIKMTKAFLQVMQNGLNILAIKVPERM